MTYLLDKAVKGKMCELGIIFAVILIASSFYVLGWYHGAGNGNTDVLMPSIYDIQRMIGVAPDGLPGPITMEAWSKACANQQGIKWYEYMEKK